MIRILSERKKTQEEVKSKNDIKSVTLFFRPPAMKAASKHEEANQIFVAVQKTLCSYMSNLPDSDSPTKKEFLKEIHCTMRFSDFQKNIQKLFPIWEECSETNLSLQVSVALTIFLPGNSLYSLNQIYSTSNYYVTKNTDELNRLNELINTRQNLPPYYNQLFKRKDIIELETHFLRAVECYIAYFYPTALSKQEFRKLITP